MVLPLIILSRIILSLGNKRKQDENVVHLAVYDILAFVKKF